MTIWDRLATWLGFGPAKKTWMPERWVPVWNCSTCEHYVTDHTRSYSHGVCPYCGAVSNGSTIDCVKSSVQVGGRYV
jgi:predicted RNA-binding Zn-ribbon protein involved in translation (DUF1610 family)